MNFNQFKQLQQNYVKEMTNGIKALFVVDVDPDLLWETYLDAFPEGTNEIFRERREYDCSCCRHFIKNFGSVVAINDRNEVQTIWDFETRDDTFSVVIKTVGDLVKEYAVRDVHVTKQNKFGTDKSREQLEDLSIQTWDHFYIELPKSLVTKSDKSEASLASTLRDNRNVFQRSLEEISQEAVQTTLELIDEKILYRGEEWQAVLQEFSQLQDEYVSLPDDQKENYCWRMSVELSGAVAKIRNHSIGTLLQDLASGMELNKALKRYESVVAPHNYKRPKAVFTKKMVEDAEKMVIELGLLDSLGRRHARLDDITINNVLWANRDAKQHMDGAGGIFEALKEDITVNPNKLKNVRPITVEDFVNEILPTASEISVLLENHHTGNLVSLIAPKVPDSKTLFKWDNNFGWAYNGNIADSMKERVKGAGGRVDGDLRFSLQWNTERDNQNDYDAHCKEPNDHIYYGHKRSFAGALDVDIIHPSNQVAVENIIYPDRNRMREGTYHFYVNNYSHRGGRSGFDAEIEFDGQIYEFSYHKDLGHKQNVTVAKVELGRSGFKILESLPSTTSSKEVWGLKTNQFHPVSSFMFSPNHWDGRGVGNRHFMFMLAGCENPDQPNGFFNEYLRESFMEHKRVFEALGNKMKVERSEYQLSGLGFSSTKRNSLICKVDDKLIKVIF